MSAALVDTETGEVIETAPTAGALVPASNMDELDRLDPAARDLAVTRMLEQSAAWLAHAKEATLPAQDIADFRAFVATAAEASKRVKVSKEIQLDAVEMVRRTEEELARAIRRGQGAGEIRRRGQGGSPRTPYERERFGRTEHVVPRDDKERNLPSPTDFAAAGELTGNGAGIYDLVDDVTETEFEQAIGSARAEGNLSRANVVRKIRAQKAKVPVSQQLDRIEEMAATGHHSTQIAKELGTTGENIRMLAKKAGIKIPADDILRGKHNLNATRIVRETVQALDGLAMGVGLIEDYSTVELTTPEAQEWAASLTDSLSVLNRFAKQIKKETTHVLDQD